MNQLDSRAEETRLIFFPKFKAIFPVNIYGLLRIRHQHLIIRWQTYDGRLARKCNIIIVVISPINTTLDEKNQPLPICCYLLVNKIIRTQIQKHIKILVHLLRP